MDSFIVFAKEPVPGRVKTRLTPPFTAEEAALLYTAFVEDVAATIASVAVPGDRKVLAAPGGASPVLGRIAAEHGFETAEQVGADLGERMKAAIAGELTRGAEAAILVGSDSPTLPSEAIREGLRRLHVTPRGARSPGSAILGPAGDGGYWLVGATGTVPDLFDGIAWSTRDVLATTLDCAAKSHTDLALLPFWYDVDDAAGVRLLDSHIEWFRGHGRTPAPKTAAALKALKAAHGGKLPG
jgi:rSAM/selenodomain-associated transferase 1